jgi:hypothetical protein
MRGAFLPFQVQAMRDHGQAPRCTSHLPSFACALLTSWTQKLAPKYFSTRFCRVFVENVPWLVERLGIKVLPCVICFVDGVSKDR